MTYLLALLLCITTYFRSCLAFDCSTYDAVGTCEAQAGTCTWVDSTGVCKCASDVKIDIFFSIDASGSIGWNSFQEAKVWLNSLIDYGIANTTRMAFETYASETNYSWWSELQFWDTDEAKSFVNHMYYSRGYTRTDWVTKNMIYEFNRTEAADAIAGFDNARQRVNILLTDGNPCRYPGGNGNCPYDICYVAERVFTTDVRVILVGVGDGLNPDNIACLMQDPDNDYFQVTSYSQDAFDAIFADLSDILCPVTYSIVITEVKVEPTGEFSSGLGEKTARFVEVWNKGTSMNVSDIEFSGLLTTDATFFVASAQEIVAQSSYVIFYDATDTYATDYPNVTCGQCDTTSCSLITGCDSSSDEPCHCTNALYLPCGNCGTSGDLATYGCCFNDTYTNDNWFVQIDDVQSSSSQLLDDVVYDSSTWIIVEDGYAYELLSKGFDNDQGDNWGQSCNNLGTPGADPGVYCAPSCSDTSCQAQGAGSASCGTSGSCECDADTGYYPSGTTCATIPEPANCTVLWYKDTNSTVVQSLALFEWTYADTSQSVGYQVTYWDKNTPDAESTHNTYSNNAIRQDYFEIDGNDYAYNTFYRVYHNSSLGVAAGYVTSFYKVGTTTYYGFDIPCILTTQSPTSTPTLDPTADPTTDPTTMPTKAPTYECLHFYFVPDSCAEYPRCECNEVKQAIAGADNGWQCCDDSDDFRTDSGNDCEYQDDEFVIGEDMYFRVDREPEVFPYNSTVCWTVTERTIIYDDDADDDDEQRRRLIAKKKQKLASGKVLNVEYIRENAEQRKARKVRSLEKRERRSRQLLASNDSSSNATYNVVGLRANPSSGCITFPYDGEAEQDISFEFELNCNYIDSDYDTDDDDCFDDVLRVEYDLNLTNCTNSYDKNGCCDIYHPDYILLKITQDDALSNSGQKSSELPAWLWWLVAALGIFLVVLAFLVYKFWWSAKQTGAALNAKTDELDAEIEVGEKGFGHDLGADNVAFNPLANGNFGANPAGNAGAQANAPQSGQAMDVARVQDDKLLFRQEFAGKMG